MTHVTVSKEFSLHTIDQPGIANMQYVSLLEISKNPSSILKMQK